MPDAIQRRGRRRIALDIRRGVRVDDLGAQHQAAAAHVADLRIALPQLVQRLARQAIRAQ